ncbi:VWA domain-containing protein [Frigoribacterium sp. ACAM 257]|uniref:VWA domain-containing protein n=1 Tax=Frigoribacterium sp. ACAM 257 TaxID=2508998 RepID=UPI001CB8E29E|nr:VWA domain-containing protein [Frigoribacterium sp. ACAM 257]
MTAVAGSLPAAVVLQPVLPWWLLVAVGGALLGFVGWRVVAERGDRRLLRSWVRRLVIVALLLVVAVRPGVPGGSAQASSAALNVFFVVDTTSSIAAEDWDGDRPRLEGVRSDVDDIASELAGARFSLISFDSTAVLRTPLTDDAAAVVTAASVMNQEITYYSSGSSITEASELLAERLREAREADPERANVVYYLGDGEQTADEAPGSFAAAAADVDGGAVLGYGTAAGGRMKVFDGYGDAYSSTEYIKDRTQPGEPDALSVIDEDALRTMASQLGVDYDHREADTGVEAVVADARDGAVDSDEGRAEAVVDLYWIAAVPLFLLALVEVAVVARALAEIRVRPRADRTPGRTSS